MAKKQKQKNITMDDDTWDMLQELERHTTLTASALFRQYVRDAFREMRKQKAEDRALLDRPQ